MRKSVNNEKMFDALSNFPASFNQRLSRAVLMSTRGEISNEKG